MRSVIVGYESGAYFWLVNNGFEYAWAGGEEASGCCVFNVDLQTHEELLQHSL